MPCRQVDRWTGLYSLLGSLQNNVNAPIFFSVSWLWSFIWSVKPLERPITNLCGYISPVWMLKHSFVRFNQTQTKTVLSSARVPLHLSWFSSPDEMLQGPGFDSSVDHFLCVILLTLMASRLYLCQCSQLFLLFMLTVYLHITKYQHSK